uniref:DUF155 domain-containing protein n=1 Tax=Panagrellus redivivus TaxID=6233 RepID=A0A7E5A0W8_PANRE
MICPVGSRMNFRVRASKVKRHSRQTVAHVNVFAKDTLFTTLPKLGRLIGLFRGTAKEIKHALYLYAFRRKLIVRPGSGAKIRVLGPGSGGSGAEDPKIWLRREDPERSLRNFENGSGSGAGGSVFSDPGLFSSQNCAKLVQNREIHVGQLSFDDPFLRKAFSGPKLMWEATRKLYALRRSFWATEKTELRDIMITLIKRVDQELTKLNTNEMVDRVIKRTSYESMNAIPVPKLAYEAYIRLAMLNDAVWVEKSTTLMNDLIEILNSIRWEILKYNRIE